MQCLKRYSCDILCQAIRNLEREAIGRLDELKRIGVLTQPLHAKEEVLGVIGHNTGCFLKGVRVFPFAPIKNIDVII